MPANSRQYNRVYYRNKRRGETKVGRALLELDKALEVNTHYRFRHDITPSMVTERYQSGQSTRQIALELECSQRLVVTRLTQAGIERRDWLARGRASYGGFHHHVRRVRGAPQHCEDCGKRSPGRYEWASLTGNYADPNDYRRLCKRCHARLDRVAERQSTRALGKPHENQRGSTHPMSKLTEADVLSIRELRANGVPYAVIARQFGITIGTASRIVHRRLWGHVG